MTRNLWAFASLLFLVFAGWQAYGTLAQAPAFNGALRVEAVTGGTRPGVMASMYDHPEYLYQVANDWTFKTLFGSMPSGEETAPAADLLEASALRTRDIVTDSLRLRPANTAAWLLLANAELSLGDRDAALAAIEKSRDLAPYSSALAFKRLQFLGRFTADRAGAEAALRAVSPDQVQVDVQTLEMHRPGLFETWLAPYPGLRPFLASTAGAE